MARVMRSAGTKLRIGYPKDADRIDVLERIIAKLIAQSTIPAQDPDKLELNKTKERLDQLDIDFPDSR